MHRRAFFVSLATVVLAACGGSDPGDSGDASGDVVYGKHPVDAGAYEAEAAAKTPDDRMSKHAGIVLASPHIRAIYIGTPNVDQSKSFDGYLPWLLTSTDYWSILAQYGVGLGNYDGRTDVSTEAFFTPGMVNLGFVDWQVLDKRVRAVIHASPSDAGAPDASDDDAGDGGDGGDGASTELPPIPPADAYVVFLPDNVNVDLGDGTTCENAAGYHSYDGAEPYAIIPPCGRYNLVVSHELAEMSTDPLPGAGWYSDGDVQNAGGEVGDLCNELTLVDGIEATRLWSNKDGDCEPQ